MGIQRLTPVRKIEAYLNKVILQKEQLLIRNMQYIGEICINKARSSQAYKDQTGNLRSSIGYMIVKDGKIVSQEGFGKVGNGSGGVSSGRDYINQLIKEFKSGIVLIVVAGMNYATYVEATGRDVLSSAELLAKTQLPILLKTLGLQ